MQRENLPFMQDAAEFQACVTAYAIDGASQVAALDPFPEVSPCNAVDPLRSDPNQLPTVPGDCLSEIRHRCAA